MFDSVKAIPVRSAKSRCICQGSIGILQRPRIVALLEIDGPHVAQRVRYFGLVSQCLEYRQAPLPVVPDQRIVAAAGMEIADASQAAANFQFVSKGFAPAQALLVVLQGRREIALEIVNIAEASQRLGRSQLRGQSGWRSRAPADRRPLPRSSVLD